MTVPDGSRRPHRPAGTAPLEVEGVDGTVVFDGQVVTIKRVGEREERIPLGSIAAVRWTPAGALHGSIAFTPTDEGAVLFDKAQQPAFSLLRLAIETAL